MKKTLSLLAVLVLVGLLGGSAPQAVSSPAVSSAAEDVMVATAMIPPILPLPFCGDFCTTPGLSRGCIDNSRQPWTRVVCTCTNGAWRC